MSAAVEKIDNSAGCHSSRTALGVAGTDFRKKLGALHDRSLASMQWLWDHMPAYFFITMRRETEALLSLALNLTQVVENRKVLLVDQDKKMLIAGLDRPGSLYDSVKSIGDREISYAEITSSLGPVPGSNEKLEVQRFEFDPRPVAQFTAFEPSDMPSQVRKGILAAMKRYYPGFDFDVFDRIFGLLGQNNPAYMEISPPERISRTMWLYQQTRLNNGLFFDIETTDSNGPQKEARILFGVVNPPRKAYLPQVMEVFQRLDLGMCRSYSLMLKMERWPYFLGTFYLRARNGDTIDKASEVYRQLKTELYNTQILCSESEAYRLFLSHRVLTGEEASLAETFVAFVHSSLAHSQPDRFDLETVKSSLYAHPDMVPVLVNLFRLRFDPGLDRQDALYQSTLAGARKAIGAYNTGRRYLDDIRRRVLETALLLITHTLKTNFFVPEKHALAFRLDPAYLDAMGSDFTADLPAVRPFRITFFYSRHGAGYHIGFSDIARGGWRTIVCRNQDEYVTAANTLFREVYVLAHTQHLKNKDIYEGGSKMTVLLDARDLTTSEAVTQRLYRQQIAFAHAFLDIFITLKGRAKDRRVVDYYGADEPIELGPDENMHDEMIETIARLALKRGYVMGVGTMSGKRAGINHKAYGVTSRGVVKTMEIAMQRLGVDCRRDLFSLKMTGGPKGDVAGNSIKLLIDNCPRVKFIGIVDGGGGLYDPEGADTRELARLIGSADIDAFRPDRLHRGGFILSRNQRRQDAMRELYRKTVRTDSGVAIEWITADDYHSELEKLTFAVKTDLFLPCGGRPETIDGHNWQRFFSKAGDPSARVVVEGANSFLTPDAREAIQTRGVIVLRDATANKCGVIASSYEIIANLLMSEREFLNHKETYVHDVIDILGRRAQEEATLIFKRHDTAGGNILYTDISAAISSEINGLYAKLFDFFQCRETLADEPAFRKVILNHMPALIARTPRYRARIKKLPSKIKFAILASEIASHIVYRGGWDSDFEHHLRAYVAGNFGQNGLPGEKTPRAPATAGIS